MKYLQVIQLNMVNKEITDIHDILINLYNELPQLKGSNSRDKNNDFDLLMRPIREALGVFKDTKATAENYRNIMYGLYVALMKTDSEDFTNLIDSVFDIHIQDKFYECAIILNTAMMVSHKLKTIYSFIYGCLRDYKTTGIETYIEFSPIYSNETDMTLLTGKVIKIEGSSSSDTTDTSDTETDGE